MNEDVRGDVLKEFRRIPGVGPKIAEDLWNLGLRSLADLKGQDPEKLYARLGDLAGCRVDRCMLYVFRCAVYYAAADELDPELLKWWNWHDRKMAER
jgi:Nucleotidyltransferase/DNA polymerase involved in DNA repair